MLKGLDRRSYHQDWTIIRNATAYPFITSDNPVAIHTSPNPLEPMTRYLPITPTLCLSVCYDGKIILPPNDPAMPPKGAVRCATASDRSPKFVNKLVAQCPEDLVFSSAPSPTKRGRMRPRPEDHSICRRSGRREGEDREGDRRLRGSGRSVSRGSGHCRSPEPG